MTTAKRKKRLTRKMRQMKIREERETGVNIASVKRMLNPDYVESSDDARARTAGFGLEIGGGTRAYTPPEDES